MITLGALGISAYAIHSSWESRQSGIESSQLELSQVTEQLTTAQQQRGRLANQISNLQAIVDVTSNAPRPSNINELAVTLVASTELHGLNLDQFEPEPPRSIGTDEIQSILIRAQCTYQALTNWLNELQSQMPDIHVVSISISTQGPEQATVATDIRLDWYIPTDQQSNTN
ncbi:MAG: hypothetical protein JJ974_06030 [Phycisphaerales bacterium]|nr:hypothetical protein [Phycisphaerales bacterium]